MSEAKETVNKIDSGIFVLAAIAAFYSAPFDAAQTLHNFHLENKKLTVANVLKIARKLNLKARFFKRSGISIKKIPLPCIVRDRDGEFFILAKLSGENALIMRNGESPAVISMQEFKNIWNKNVILIKKNSKSTKEFQYGLNWFLSIIIKYKTQLLEVLVASFTLQILGIFTPIITQVVIDKVLVHNNLTTLDVMIIGLIGITVFETAMSFARNRVFTDTTSKIDVILGANFLERLIHLPLAFFENRRTGEIVARARELETVRRFLTGTPLTSILDAVFIIVYIAIMFFYSRNLTLVVILSLPLYALLSLIATPIFKKQLDEKFAANAESQSYMVETVTGINTIKSLALEPKMKDSWGRLLANYTMASYKTAVFSGNVNAIAGFFQKVFDLIVLWLGARLAMQGDITIGQMIAFRMLAGRVSGPVLRLIQLRQEFTQTKVAIERIGVVGRSGSGKSTVAKLIQRLYVPESGKILIDGIDAALAETSWLRRQIGAVPQESFLLSMTIRENIAINNSSATVEDIIKACKMAGAHDFISELPEGYDTPLGENGTGLSGGQKQRIAIARALIDDPRVLIFDEATSALDYESESVINSNLKLICEGRTVIIIAHRLSTLQGADAILVLDKGQLAEYGPPETLLRRNGLFSYLYNQQFAKAAIPNAK